MKLAMIAAVLLLAAGSASAQDAKAGEKLYADQKCAVCHSIAGKGNLKGALDDVNSRLTADEIRMWVTDAKAMTAKTKAERQPSMREDKLPNDQGDALVAYLLTLKKK